MRILCLFVLIFVTATSVGHSFECKVCHSKNPAMLKMHNALKGQGCFGCHKVGAKLMGKGQPKDMESLLKRRQAEEVCLPCHAPVKIKKDTTQGTYSSNHQAR